ncbi:MAG: NAD(P)H-dependent oxidoreductase [Pseudomonadota bacterium]
MRALVIYCHPSSQSFTAAVRDVVVDKLRKAGAATEVIDLYAEGFDARLSPEEWACYIDGPKADCPRMPHIDALKAADTLIFVYPTWWYGMPAVLKGWLDRVLLPDVAFHLPPDGPITPGLRHIKRLGVFTTCGASWWLTRFIGAPGRRTLLRGLRLLCARRTRTAFCAHYSMDASTADSRARHLRRVAVSMDRLIGRPRDGAAETAPARA